MVSAEPNPDTTADLDTLLDEYSSSVGVRPAGNGGHEPLPSDSTPSDGGESRSNGTNETTYIEDLVDPRFTELRAQASYAAQRQAQANRAVELARREVQSVQDRADEQKLYAEIKGEFTHVEDDEIEGWIFAQARRNPAIRDIWNNRANNPKAFEGMSRQLSRQFAKKMRREPDPALTEDREAVVAAVRGASLNRAPEERPTVFGNMSNVEYRNEVKQRYGFDPGV